MKFTIEVEMDKNNHVTMATAITLSGRFVLDKAKVDHPPGESWLVFTDNKRNRMIVLSQMSF